MGAGVHVRPHTGPTNAKLTLHYGLDVPSGPSGRALLRVGSEPSPYRAVEEGRTIAFDDSFEHEVWQNGSRARTTLVLHVRHPDLEGEWADVLPARRDRASSLFGW